MDALALPGLSDWQLEFARLFAYPVESPLSMQQQWWQDLAGQPDDFELHETKQSRKVSGSFQGARLSLTIDPNRIMWEVQPAPKSDDLPTLGPFREKLDWVVELLTPWLANSCPPSRRLAFGGKFLQAAATQEQAFRVLAAHLPGVKLEPNPNNFVLQINRRKDSNVVKGLGLNRVSTWAKMDVVYSVEPGKPFQWPEKCYSALDLDINTAPEQTDILPRECLRELLRELRDHAVAIAEHGDIVDEYGDHSE
ncbi:MAG: hypothetical protein L0312_01665 [Acidobacteria bacterium]|nr:hypothetical protein [Acidobacteriota bacterium]